MYICNGCDIVLSVYMYMTPYPSLFSLAIITLHFCIESPLLGKHGVLLEGQFSYDVKMLS